MHGVYACVYVVAHVRMHMCEGILMWVNVHEHWCRVQKLTEYLHTTATHITEPVACRSASLPSQLAQESFVFILGAGILERGASKHLPDFFVGAEEPS